MVSFATDATTRVPWSYDAAVINAGIDQITADGKTSISDGFEAARQLFADDGRVGATKIVLLLLDGEQIVDAAPGKMLWQTAVDAAALPLRPVKGDGASVFAWGLGDQVSLFTLEQIATDPSKAVLVYQMRFTFAKASGDDEETRGPWIYETCSFMVAGGAPPGSGI